MLSHELKCYTGCRVLPIHQSKDFTETHFMSLKTVNNSDGILFSVHCPQACLHCVLSGAWSVEKDIRCKN